MFQSFLIFNLSLSQYLQDRNYTELLFDFRGMESPLYNRCHVSRMDLIANILSCGQHNYVQIHHTLSYEIWF